VGRFLGIDFRIEENFANREALAIQNTSKLAVHATFSLFNKDTSDIFILDPTSMLVEPGQKQVSPLSLLSNCWF